MKLKKIFATALISILYVGVLSACGNKESGSNSEGEEKIYNIDVGHVVTTNDAYHLALEKFAENVKEKSGGRINIEIFPSSQLGNERDLVEGITMGTVDMAVVASGNVAAFTNTYQPFDLPFIFRDHEHAHKVLDGEIGQQALKSLDSLGIKGLANWENGFYNTWNAKHPINTPEDFKDLKIRANDNPIHIASYDALGASAITMGWSEVYTAIQNGTVDGVAVSIPSMYNSKIYEVAPYISTSSEFYVTAILMMNKNLFDGMPEDLQQILVEEANAVTAYERQLVADMETEFIQKLKDEGFEVTNPDKEALKEAAWQPVYDEYADKLGKDVIESIQNDY
ncbi:DctP family TRAP transporter solute-binding subunit [Caldibacillus lycopersici]|uniref:DctP family TRAP transporter solute-binding subunit n=1 Tax=Perspicuibacillus lycopersici TaxID=1325689 RepID=A0AAE3IUI7_9BACI|nr:DctP family TRAP transporter solute-binding subunit [Perspicuibacillus lycopersici]MCU9614885.1 DctP family TRAP transporter solute-binding subunit [Perspicuibacillus lycopersici]